MLIFFLINRISSNKKKVIPPHQQQANENITALLNYRLSEKKFKGELENKNRTRVEKCHAQQQRELIEFPFASNKQVLERPSFAY
jgi:hypothetical protein